MIEKCPWTQTEEKDTKLNKMSSNKGLGGKLFSNILFNCTTIAIRV